jgi:drug/metabolite transporter (DMT)-like permease
MHRWLLWTLVAVFCWGVWALLGKLIGDVLSPALTQALSTIGLIPVILALGLNRQVVGRASRLPGGRLALEGTHAGETPPAADETPAPPLQRRRGALFALGAGTLTCLGNVAYYSVLNRGAKAATVVPLTALYPVVTVLLAVIILKERLNVIQIAGIVLSLIAIYLFNVQQEQGFLSAWLLVALIPIMLWGIAGLLQKLATNDISGELSTLWFLAAFVPVAACILVQQSLPASISPRTWLLVSALGLTFALGNYALLAAFASNGKASVITPLAGLYPLVSIPIAIFLLGERIGWRESLGITLALVSAAALSCESRPAPSGISNLKPELPT